MQYGIPSAGTFKQASRFTSKSIISGTEVCGIWFTPAGKGKATRPAPRGVTHPPSSVIGILKQIVGVGKLKKIRFCDTAPPSPAPKLRRPKPKDVYSSKIAPSYPAQGDHIPMKTHAESQEDAHATTLESQEDADATTLESQEDAHATTLESQEDAHATTLESQEDAHATTLESQEDAHATILESQEDTHATTLESQEDAHATILAIEAVRSETVGQGFASTDGSSSDSRLHPGSNQQAVFY
jgi:hypothetical protein